MGLLEQTIGRAGIAVLERRACLYDQGLGDATQASLGPHVVAVALQRRFKQYLRRIRCSGNSTGAQLRLGPVEILAKRHTCLFALLAKFGTQIGQGRIAGEDACDVLDAR